MGSASSSDRLSNGVTIGIPNWNHRNFLGRSVRSALKTAEALGKCGLGCQVLVVDDFSRDGSQRLLNSMALQDQSGNLEIVLASENSGLAAARNTAIANARYSTVCFLDADNELIPENMITFWRAMSETKAAFVYGNLIVTDGVVASRVISNDFLQDEILTGNYVDAFALVNADLIEELGGYYGKHAAAHEDWELLLHLIAENQRIVFVPALLGYYHTGELSMIRTVQYEHAKMHRVFNQRGTGFAVGFANRNIYHPDVGWL